jgi:branched-chain amino acid transport system ATP-binding protein
MLAIGRALMSRPKLLLLDEPSMGLAPIMVQKIFEVVRRGRRWHDHPAHRAERQAGAGMQPARLCDGKRRDHAAWRVGQLLGDPKVRAAYLGE